MEEGGSGRQTLFVFVIVGGSMGVSPSARPPAPGRPVDRDRSPPNEQRAAAEAEVTIASEELGKGKEGVRVVRESAAARGSQKGGRPWLAAWRVIQVLKDHFIPKLPRLLPSVRPSLSSRSNT